MNDSNIINQLLGGEYSIKLLVSVFILFILALISKALIKGGTIPIGEFITFLSRQRLRDFIHRMMVNWAKNKDNQAKIAGTKELLKFEPDNIELHKKLAELYVNAKNQRLNAFNEYLYVFENNPVDRDAFNYLLNDVLKTQNFDQAQSFIDISGFVDKQIIQVTLNELLKYNKEIDIKIEATSFFFKGRLYKVKESYIDIIRYSLGLIPKHWKEMFSHITDDTLKYSETFNSLALLYQNLALYEQVANNYRISLTFFNNINISNKLGRTLFNKLNKYEEARACFEKAIELDQSSAATYNSLGSLLTDNFKEHKKAKTCFEKALNIAPDSAVLHNNLGNATTRLKQHEDARACFEKAIKIDPNFASAYGNLGSLLVEEFKLYEEAKVCFEKSIKIDPKDSCTYTDLGILLFSEFNQYKEAKACYEKAIKINPFYVNAHHHLGNLFLVQHQYLEAIACYEKTIKIDPHYVGAYVGIGCVFSTDLKQHELAKTNFYKNLYQPELAKKYFIKAIEIDANYSVAYINLGNLNFFKLNNYKEAKACYEKAIKIEPNRAVTYFYLGRLLADKLDRYEKAKESYKKAIKIDKGFTEAYLHLGKLLSDKLDNHEEALVCYEKARKIDPEYTKIYLS